MFYAGSDTLQEIRAHIKRAADKTAFGQAIESLRGLLKALGADSEVLLELEQRAYYPINNYSDKDTKEKMQEAKERVLVFIDRRIEAETAGTELLVNVLENFYFFLESLLEREPHRKSSI